MTKTDQELTPDYLRAPDRLEQHDPYDSGYPYLDREDVYDLIDRELGTLAVALAGPLGTDARVERVRTTLLDALGPGPLAPPSEGSETHE